MSNLHVVTKQYRENVIRPVLKKLDAWSQAAESLLVGTGLVESEFHYIKQINGPAVSVFQIEPATISDNYKNFLNYRPNLRSEVDQLNIIDDFESWSDINPFFACAHARVWYLRHSEPFPSAANVEGLAQYWKKYYNTAAGKGEVNRFIQLYTTYGEMDD